MKKVTEPELTIHAKSGAIEKLTLKLNEEETGYWLYADLKYQGAGHVLVVQRGHPRLWTSADRLLAHIRKNYLPIADITVLLQEPSLPKN